MSESDWFSDEMATFGDRLAGAREQAGLTPDQLAERIGVQLETIEAWEDDVRDPRANRLQMLAGMLNVSLSWLLTGKGDGPEAPTDVEPMADDLLALLAEMRGLRSQLAQSTDKLGQLEKRLRAALKEPA